MSLPPIRVGSDTGPLTADFTMGDTAYYTTDEVAHMCGVQPETVRRWCRAGRLPSAKPGHRRVIPATAVASLLTDAGATVAWAGVA